MRIPVTHDLYDPLECDGAETWTEVTRQGNNDQSAIALYKTRKTLADMERSYKENREFQGASLATIRPRYVQPEPEDSDGGSAFVGTLVIMLSFMFGVIAGYVAPAVHLAFFGP